MNVQVAVFRSTSTGTPSFAAAQVYTTSSQTSGDFVVAGNLTLHGSANGQPALDSYPEIIVGGNNGSTGNSANGTGSGEYTIFFNKGDGTFGTEADNQDPPYTLDNSHYIHAMELGDVDGDGFRDLITIESNDNNGQTYMQVYGGRQDGRVGAGGSTYVAIGTNTNRTFRSGIAVGDLNGDGKVDIAYSFENKLEILALDATPGHYPGDNPFFYTQSTGAGTTAVALTDSNRDGALDLLLAGGTGKELSLLVNGGSAPPVNPPSIPTINPTLTSPGQTVTLSSTFSSTSAGAKVVFQQKSSGSTKWTAAGTGRLNGGVYALTFKAPATGLYTYRAEGSADGSTPAFSGESDVLQVGLKKPAIVGYIPAKGQTPAALIVLEPSAAGVTFTVQSSADGSSFGDVTGVSITSVGGGRYIIRATSLPADQPYFRVVAHLTGVDDVTSGNFSLFAVDATIAQVTNDSSAADDATSVVRTSAPLGAAIINTSGAQQTKTIRAVAGAFNTFAVRLVNPSKFLEAVSVNGPAGTNDFEVRYFASAGTSSAPLIGSEITSTVTSSGYPVSLPAGANATVYLRVRSYPGTPRAEKLNLPITCIVGGDTSRRDVVQVTASATNAVKAVFVTNSQPSGEGSLAEAIGFANTHPGTTIEFEVPSDDPNWSTYENHPLLTIACTTELPPITAAGTILDAASQRELPDQTYSATAPAVELLGFGIADSQRNVALPNEIGFNIQAAGCAVRGLQFNQFATAVSIYGRKAQRNVVEGCHFIGNTNIGASLENGASDNVVGGASLVQRNVFRGLRIGNLDYGKYGVAILGHSSHNKVQGNNIGTTQAGESDPHAPNGFGRAGVLVTGGSEGNLIGGTVKDAGNLISGNWMAADGTFSAGIRLESSNNLVEGNLIGTNNAGTASNKNYDGILVQQGTTDTGAPLITHGNTIGSSSALGGNVISGNWNGIRLTSGVATTRIFGNYIGTDIRGQASVANRIGISLNSYYTLIGGVHAEFRNVISGNTLDGILSQVDSGASVSLHNAILGNYVGVNATNTAALGNGANGIEIYGGQTEIGESHAETGNIIANNGYDGVVMHGLSSGGIYVRGNSTYNNGYLGLDVLPGDSESTAVTPNDAHDADGVQNYPELSTVVKAAGNNAYKVTGVLHTLPSTANAKQYFALDFYLSDIADGSGHGEGKIYLGYVKGPSDTNGDASFSPSLTIPAAGLPASGKVITATATRVDVNGNSIGGTSEFSNDLTLP